MSADSSSVPIPQEGDEIRVVVQFRMDGGSAEMFRYSVAGVRSPECRSKALIALIRGKAEQMAISCRVASPFEVGRPPVEVRLLSRNGYAAMWVNGRLYCETSQSMGVLELAKTLHELAPRSEESH